VPSTAGGDPQCEVWLSPGRSKADGGGNGGFPGVEVPGAGGMGLPPPEADRRLTIATPVQAPRMRVPAGSGLCSSPFPLGPDPTGTRPTAGAPSGSTHPEAVLSGAGTHFGAVQLPDVTTWGGGSVPPPAREPAGGSSSRAPPGSRSAKGAPELEHSAETHGISPPALGPGGRSPLGAWEGGAMPESAREPAGGSSSRAPPGSLRSWDGQGLEWRDAVAEVARSEVTRALVTIRPH